MIEKWKMIQLEILWNKIEHLNDEIGQWIMLYDADFGPVCINWINFDFQT